MPLFTLSISTSGVEARYRGLFIFSSNPVHPDAAAVDCSEPAVAFKDECHGKCRMELDRGSLIRHNELQPGIQSVRDERGIFHVSFA